MRIEQGWCPTCREWTVIDAGEPCAWCGTEVIIQPKRTRTRQTLINDAQARIIYVKYRQGWSARKLGKVLFHKLGFSSSQACAKAIGQAFVRLGLPVRSQVRATVLASTVHGLSPTDKRERRLRRSRAGLNTETKQPLQPVCVAVNKRKRKGQPCSKPARRGSLYCHSHAGEE